jgi:hypothetical protein
MTYLTKPWPMLAPCDMGIAYPPAIQITRACALAPSGSYAAILTDVRYEDHKAGRVKTVHRTPTRLTTIPMLCVAGVGWGTIFECWDGIFELAL